MAEGYQNVLQEVTLTYSLPSANAGDNGYVAIDASALNGKKIISTCLGSSHPGVTSLQVSGFYSGTSNELYVTYYAPKWFSQSNHVIQARIVYE